MTMVLRLEEVIIILCGIGIASFLSGMLCFDASGRTDFKRLSRKLPDTFKRVCGGCCLTCCLSIRLTAAVCIGLYHAVLWLLSERQNRWRSHRILWRYCAVGGEIMRCAISAPLWLSVFCLYSCCFAAWIKRRIIMILCCTAICIPEGDFEDLSSVFLSTCTVIIFLYFKKAAS